MHSFASLLRTLRGDLPRREIARRVGLTEHDIERLETGEKIATRKQAERILERGFDLSEAQVLDYVLDVEFFDLGLTDRTLRRLAIDLMTHQVPPAVEEQLRQLYRPYASRRRRDNAA